MLNTDMIRFGVFISYEEITGQKPTLDQLHKILSPYRCRDVLVVLAKLNSVLKHWRNRPDLHLDRRLIQDLFPHEPRLLQIYCQKGPDRLLFSRVGLLYLAKQASASCSEGGRQIVTVQDARHIAVACLMANDLLHSRSRQEPSLIEFLASELPYFDYVSRDTQFVDIGRNICIFNDIAKSPGACVGRGLRDLAADFLAATGLEFRIFTQLVLSVAAPYLTLSYEDLLTEPAKAFVLPNFFSQMKVTEEQVGRFWQLVSQPYSQLAGRVEMSPTRPGGDFTDLQDKPVVALDDGSYICLDPGFLLDKAGRALFWTMFSVMPDDKRRLLFGRWGEVFEFYVNWLFGQAYHGPGEFVLDARFEDGDQAFDCYLREGSSLCVVETKSSVIRADAKYGFDAGRLRSELERKFIKGDKKEKKGVAQLESSLVRLLSGERIPGLDVRGVKKIYPILLGLDPTLLAPLMARYVRSHFPNQHLGRKFKRVITPLAVLGISDVELLLPYTNCASLSSILESRYRATGEMPGTIHPASVPILESLEPGDRTVQERFRAFLVDTKELFV